jgi:hypothetical protein
MSSAIAIAGAIIIVLGLVLGLATGNTALTSISLTIGAGGAIGWLVAGGVSRRNR